MYIKYTIYNVYTYRSKINYYDEKANLIRLE